MISPRQIIVCLCYYLISQNSILQINGEIDWALVDSKVSDYVTRLQVPGLGVAIVNTTSTGETLDFTAKGYGVMDREFNIPMSNDTRVLIASISKSFTATVTCRFLAQRYPNLGKDVLDTPIIQLAPRYNLTLIDRYRTEHLTFRDLLSHRVCINSYGLGVTAGAYNSRDDRLYRYRYIREKCGFRNRFEYSNAMMILAGSIVSNIAGVPFEDLVYEFLGQLDMTDSLIVTPTDDYETLPKMSRGYYWNLDNVLTKMNASTYNHSGAAAGGIISTAQDMGKYIAFHLSKGKNIFGDQIVPENILDWLYETSNFVQFSGHKSPQNPSTGIAGYYGYGLGLDLGVYGDGYFQIGHEGDLSPFTSQMTFHPSLGLGIFTAANGPGYIGRIEDKQLTLHNEIMDILMGKSSVENKISSSGFRAFEKMTPRKTKLNKTFTWNNTKEKLDPATLAGTYGHPYEGDVNISWNGTNLQVQYGIWGKAFLTEEGDTDNLYRVNWEGDIVAMLLAYSGGPPLGDFLFYFDNPSRLQYIDSDGGILYLRDATIDTYPPIPWEEGSCRKNE